MIRKTNLKIVFAHLTSRVKQTMVAILSVTFGISMYIFLNSFMNGVNGTQTELAFSTLAHIRVYNDLPEDRSNLLAGSFDQPTAINIRNARVIQYREGIRNSAKVLHTLAALPQIKAYTPQVNINVFFRNGASQVNGLLSGVEVVSEETLFKPSQYMAKGQWNDLGYRADGIVLGKGLAKKLSVKLHDKVMVATASGITRSYEIIGIIETTLANVDNAKAFIKIGAARQLLSKNAGYVTDIQVNIGDFDQARKVADKLRPLVDFKVEPWQEANGQLDAANSLRNILAVAVSFTILLVAGFGIYNIMNMTVNEKIREIAILKAMGFNGRDIIEIFLTQSVIIGMLGGVVGMALGNVISRIVNQIPFQIATLETLPIAYQAEDYIMASVFGLCTTFIAGYLPARKAANIDPVEIIRG
ncbi:FtsX-like permease family protein [uncultured Microscilla sp.]|uniref:ABC transporter permease n=1 Tax=uncultured Microscilla sp. TaxID=432653 RepID=UPI0026223399|nr:FtsX-like permease family protein [uncultured Microscilla sp.]